MSNPHSTQGQDTGGHSGSDKPEQKSDVSKQDEAQIRSASDKTLSINDLMSLKRSVKPDYQPVGEFGQLSLTEGGQKPQAFDGKRTTDITRLLGNKGISRQLSDERAGVPKMQGDFTPTQMLDANANMGLTIPLGLRQHFRLRGVEVKKPEDTEKLKDLKSQADDLLKKTPLKDESKLTPAEHDDLVETRNNLADADNLEDLLSNSLHLARLYLHLRYIEEARKATMFAMGVDPNSVLAKQVFKELERVHPQDLAASPVTTTLLSLNKTSLQKRIINLSKGRIIVVGDLLIDELLEGRPERISREAPVLILEHVDTVLIPGGAANTAHNIAALGGKCHAIGVCGNDEYAGKMRRMLESHRITHDVVTDPSRPTTVKTRILSKSHSLMQQLLRLDRISHDQISDSIARQMIAKIASAAPNYAAIILSDYKSGAITDGVITACREISQTAKTMLVVDAQNRFERFAGCTLITPNQPDTEAAIGYKIKSKVDIERAGADMLRKSNAEAVLITRGGEGMALFQKNQPMLELPVFNKSEVFDVTGAGDTVVATMTLALVTGASPLEAMALGNLAAGIVVKKSGTAVTSQAEMLDSLEYVEL